MSGDVGPRLNGEVWADHGHPGEVCSPPEAVRGVMPCRLVTAPVSGDVGLTETLVTHSRCTLTGRDGMVTYDCGIVVPLSLASHHAHLAAALEPLVAERVREAEEERDAVNERNTLLRNQAEDQAQRIGTAEQRARVAEAALVEAEQRGAVQALRDAAEEEDWRGVMFNRDRLDLSPADRVRHRIRARADRLAGDQS